MIGLERRSADDVSDRGVVLRKMLLLKGLRHSRHNLVVLRRWFDLTATGNDVTVPHNNSTQCYQSLVR